MNEYIRIKPRVICSKCNSELPVNDITPNYSDYNSVTVDLMLSPCKHCLNLLNALDNAGVIIGIKKEKK